MGSRGYVLRSPHPLLLSPLDGFDDAISPKKDHSHGPGSDARRRGYTEMAAILEGAGAG